MDNSMNCIRLERELWKGAVGFLIFFCFVPEPLLLLHNRSLLWSFFNLGTLSLLSRWQNHSSSGARPACTARARLCVTALRAEDASRLSLNASHQIHLQRDELTLFLCERAFIQGVGETPKTNSKHKPYRNRVWRRYI